MRVSKLLFALMLAAGAASVAFGPATAEEKKKAAPGGSTAEINAQDCKVSPPGEKGKKMAAPKPGEAVPCGEVGASEGKAKVVSKEKDRAAVKEEVKKGARTSTGVGGPGDTGAGGAPK